MLRIGNITIKKVYHESGDFWYFSFKDVEDPGYEYKEFVDGSKEWYRNGERHREDGPAVIWPNGTQYWLRNGEYHREDGPAMIDTKGIKIYCLNGRTISKEKFYNLTNSKS